MKKSILFAAALTFLATGLAFAEGPKKGHDENKGRPALDKNGDGKITRDEVRAHADARFERMDVNKDGVIDAQEARGDGGPHKGRGCDDERDDGEAREHEPREHGAHRGGMRHFLETADANKDGKLSATEADAFGKARFAEMDANKDGFLTKDEVRPKKHHARDAK